MAVDRTKLNFDANANYQKIYMEDSAALSVANPSSVSSLPVLHLLGRRPNVKVWWTNGSGKICTAVSSAAANLSSLTTDFDDRSVYYKINTTTLTIYFDRTVTVGPTRTTTVYYRIYADGI